MGGVLSDSVMSTRSRPRQTFARSREGLHEQCEFAGRGKSNSHAARLLGRNENLSIGHPRPFSTDC